jgi:hypothetical protein
MPDPRGGSLRWKRSYLVAAFPSRLAGTPAIGRAASDRCLGGCPSALGGPHHGTLINAHGAPAVCEPMPGSSDVKTKKRTANSRRCGFSSPCQAGEPFLRRTVATGFVQRRPELLESALKFGKSIRAGVRGPSLGVASTPAGHRVRARCRRARSLEAEGRRVSLNYHEYDESQDGTASVSLGSGRPRFFFEKRVRLLAGEAARRAKACQVAHCRHRCGISRGTGSARSGNQRQPSGRRAAGRRHQPGIPHHHRLRFRCVPMGAALNLELHPILRALPLAHSG